MKKQRIFLLGLLLSFAAFTFAQEFAAPFDAFSRSKTAYIHMKDGSVKEGVLDGFKRTKGLIELVKLETPNGRKLELTASRISHMYLAPSVMAKISAATDMAYKVHKWGSKLNYDTVLMREGYVYFEQVPAIVKGNKEMVLLQMVNTDFSTQIKVYHDPWAGETASFGNDLIAVGGIDKSYYVWKKDENAANRLKKADYKEEFRKLYGASPAFIKSHRDNMEWRDFATHVYDFTVLMEGE
jgi:hypothetical protein